MGCTQLQQRVNLILTSVERKCAPVSEDGLFVKNGLQLMIQELKDATPETERSVVEAFSLPVNPPLVRSC